MAPVSFSIMAHPKRRHFVEELGPQFDGAAPVIWDRSNNRWDTGRRAMAAYDPAATWHVVVQDDAVLCHSFPAGVAAALAGVPPENPVSFYTGKVRPYAEFVEKAVAGARANGKHWFKMRGPLWGVAIAVPTHLIDDMLVGADEVSTSNYDMRISEYFHEQGKNCWYSIPSLVNHRVGSENPSLVRNRGNSAARTAHQFIGREDPTKIDWDTGAYIPGDPSQPWTEECVCTSCWKRFDTLPEVMIHAFDKHGVGKIDFLASTPYHARTLYELRSELPPLARGEFYVVGPDVSHKLKFPHHRLNRSSAARRIGKRGPFTMVGAQRDLKFIGNRPGLSLVEGTPN